MTPLNHSLHVAVPTAFDHAERLDTEKNDRSYLATAKARDQIGFGVRLHR